MTFVCLFILFYLPFSNCEDSGLTACGTLGLNVCELLDPSLKITAELNGKGYFCTDDANNCLFRCESSNACKYAHFFCGSSSKRCEVQCKGTNACQRLNLNCQDNHDCVIKMDISQTNSAMMGNPDLQYTTANMICPSTEHSCSILADNGFNEFRYAFIQGRNKGTLVIDTREKQSGENFMANAKIQCPNDAPCIINLRTGKNAGQQLKVIQQGTFTNTDGKSTARADLTIISQGSDAAGTSLGGTGSGPPNNKYSEIQCPSNGQCRIVLGNGKASGRLLKVDGNQNSRLEVISPEGVTSASCKHLENAEIKCPKSGSCDIVCAGGSNACQHLKVTQDDSGGSNTAPLRIRLAKNSQTGGANLLRYAIIECPNAASCEIESGAANTAGGRDYPGNSWSIKCPNPPHTCVVIRNHFAPDADAQWANNAILNCADGMDKGVMGTKDFYYCKGRTCPNNCHGCYEAETNICHPLHVHHCYEGSTDGRQWCTTFSCPNQYLDVLTQRCVSICGSGDLNKFHILENGQRVCGELCPVGTTCQDQGCNINACVEGESCCKKQSEGGGTCTADQPKSFNVQKDANGCGSNLDLYGFPETGARESYLQRTTCCKDPPPPAPDRIGQNCWSDCRDENGNSQSGSCGWCGTHLGTPSRCCRKNWQNGEKGCLASEGGNDHHICTTAGVFICTRPSTIGYKYSAPSSAGPDRCCEPYWWNLKTEAKTCNLKINACQGTETKCDNCNGVYVTTPDPILENLISDTFSGGSGWTCDDGWSGTVITKSCTENGPYIVQGCIIDSSQQIGNIASANLRIDMTKCTVMNEGSFAGCPIVIDSHDLVNLEKTDLQINCTSMSMKMVVTSNTNNFDAANFIVGTPPFSVRVIAPFDYNKEIPAIKKQTVICSLLNLKTNVLLDTSPPLIFQVRNVLLPRLGIVRKELRKQDQNLEKENKVVPLNDNEYGRNLIRNGRNDDRKYIEIITSGQAYLKITTGREGRVFFYHPTLFLVTSDDDDDTDNTAKIIPLKLHSWTATEIIVSLPDFQVACPTPFAMCYWGLQINNNNTDSGDIGGTMSCPSEVNGKQSLNTLSSSACDIYQQSGVSATPLPPLSTTLTTNILSTSPSSYAIKYVLQCEGYLEPGSSECVELDTASKCAFGFGDSCRACAYGGSCPGGNEIRSFPGFFTTKFRGNEVVACRPPSIERCIGYNPDRTNETLCGVGYRGKTCNYCAGNHYEIPDGSCKKCGDTTGMNNYELWNAAFPFCLTSLILLISMTSIIYGLEITAHQHETEMIARQRKSIDTGVQRTRAESFDRRASACDRTIRHVKEFCIWFVLSAQVMASASSSPAPGLPDWILRLYASISFFNLDTSYVVHPDCAPDPTIFPSLILCGALCITLLQSVLFAFKPFFTHIDVTQNSIKTTLEKYASFQGLTFVGMSFIYPIICKVTWASLHCDDNGTFGARNDPCWQGTHLRLGILAFSTFVIYLIGFPFVTLFYLQCVIIKQDRKPGSIRTKARLARWEHFIDDDYKPRYFWFRHVYWLLSLLLFAIYEYVAIGFVRCILTLSLFAIYLFMLHKYKPFSRTERWKLYVRTALVIVSVLVAVLDVAQFSKDHIGEGDGVSLDDEGSDGVGDGDGNFVTPSSSSLLISSELNANNSTGDYLVLGLSYLLAVSCVMVMIILPGSFFTLNYNYRCRNCCSKNKNTLTEENSDEENSSDEENGGQAAVGIELSSSIKNPMRKNKSIEGSTEETFKKRSISNTDVLKENVDGWNRHFNKEYQRWYWYSSITKESRWEEV